MESLCYLHFKKSYKSCIEELMETEMYKVTQMFKLKEEIYRKQSEKLLELLGGIK